MTHVKKWAMLGHLPLYTNDLKNRFISNCDNPYWQKIIRSQLTGDFSDSS